MRVWVGMGIGVEDFIMNPVALHRQHRASSSLSLDGGGGGGDRFRCSKPSALIFCFLVGFMSFETCWKMRLLWMYVQIKS